MAATQAESQLNDTNREHLPDKPHPSEIGNSTFQNGTDKNGAKSAGVGSEVVPGGKVKFSTHYSVDMSQYRQESNCGPPMHNEQINDDCATTTTKLNSDKAYLQSIDNGNNEINYNKGLPEPNAAAAAASNVQQNYNMQYSARNYVGHPDHGGGGPPQMNSVDSATATTNTNNIHAGGAGPPNQFTMRHSYPNSKPMPPGSRPMQPPHMNTHAANFNPHSHPQRFMSGQSISQQMGPTPTLNQLLQSSNPVHRYQNNYAEYPNQKADSQAPFNHAWNTRPMPPYMNQQSPVPYRAQMPQQQQQQQNASVRCNTIGVPPSGPGGPPGPGGAYPSQPPPGSAGPPSASSYPSHPPAPSSPSSHPGAPSGPPGPPVVGGGPPPGPPGQQQPPTGGSQQAGGQAGPPLPQQYQPYPGQRYPGPPGGPPQQAPPVRVPAYPAPHHQMGSPYGPMSQGPNMQAAGSPYAPPSDQRLPWSPMPTQQQQQPPLGGGGPPQQPGGPPMPPGHQQPSGPSQPGGPPGLPPMQQQPPQPGPPGGPPSQQQPSSGGPPPPGQPQHGPLPPHSNSQSPQHPPTQQAPSHIPPNSPVPPAPSTPTPHSASSTPQQHSPQSALTSPQSVHPEASPQQTHQPQQSPQHTSQSFGSSRPNLTSTTPEPGDLTSQNSNDSSSGGGPQAMRPTPSPTGSTGSRSMSPAIGQQNIPMPPRPSSGQSDSGSTSSQSRLSHSPMAPTQGGYQQPLGPPHMHNYKMGSAGPQGSLHPVTMIPNPSGGPPYPQIQPHQPFNQQGAYPGPGRGVQSIPPYHQSYGMQQPGAGSHSQYPARPMPNHVPHSQFPGFQGWPPPNVSVTGPSQMSSPGTPSPTNHIASPVPAGKGVPPPASSPQHQQQQPPLPPSQQPSQPSQGPGGPGHPGGGAGPPNQHHPMHHMHPQQQPPGGGPPQPPQSPQQQSQPPPQSPQMGQNCSPGPRSHTPPQYLKQHLQHKVGFNNNSGMPPSPGPPPGMYGNSSPSPGMGPLHHHPMGPPVPTGPGHHHMGGAGPMAHMMPPHSNSHHDSSMPPPSSTPNSHPLPSSSMQSDSGPMDSIHHDGSGAPLTTMAQGNMTNVSQINSGGITSVVTTGPDGAPIDEASQQSTLSNTSAASGEDPSSTPKRKESAMGIMGSMSGYLGHGHSQGPVPPCSPSMNSMHDDYPSEGNAPWSRTPSSPKHDSLGKLYDMDDSPERRIWLDKLLHFMEERNTPISSCPTISKNPLDLFRLYVYVKERGGFMEVTKNKIWKDIAGLLGIGASSSAAYTLRKHYTKNLLPFECHFDRGGIDPQPIINQVESSTKKKNAKNASVPSPGSSNSQDSFPSGPGGGMDGYGAYGGYGNEYANQRGPPQMQSNQGMSSQPGAYQSQPGYNQYPPADQYGQQYISSGSYPPSRPMYPVYPPDAERGYSQTGSSNAMSGPGTPGGPPQQQQSAPSPAVTSGPGPGGSDPYSRSPYGQPMYHAGVRPPFAGGPGGPPGLPQQPPGVPPQQQQQQQQQQQPSSMPPGSSAGGPGVVPGSGQTPNSHVVPSPPRPDSQPSPSPYPPSPQQPAGPGAPSQQPGGPPGQPHMAQQQGPPGPGPQGGPPQTPQTSQPPQPGTSQQQQQQQQIPPSQSPHHEFYRPDQPYLNQNQIPSPGGASYPGAGVGPNKGMPPPPVQQSRRHPDFAKDSQQSPPPQSYSPYNNQQPRPMFAGWPNDSANRNQYPRGPYPTAQANVPPNVPPQQWAQAPISRAPVPPNAQPPPNAQWDQHRYPPNSQQQSFPPPQPGQWNMQSSGPMVQNSNLRPPPRGANFRDKSFPPMPPAQAVKPVPAGPVPAQQQPSQAPVPAIAPPQNALQPSFATASPAAAAALKREPVFPADSVEAVTPLLYKRKRLTKNDVAPVDAWKLMMSLRSGLLGETCWALDVLNILLYDDTGVQYFGLAHLPGLLDILLEHFNRSLTDMLENSIERSGSSERKWYEKPLSESSEPDLGRVSESIDEKDRLPLRTKLPDYTLKSRRGSPVAIVDGSQDLFVKNGPRWWEDGYIKIEDVVEPDSRYIVSCFRSEFGIVPFARLLPEANNKNKKRKTDTNTDSDINHRTKALAPKLEPKLEPKTEPRDCSNTNGDIASPAAQQSNLSSPVPKIKSEPETLVESNDESMNVDESLTTTTTITSTTTSTVSKTEPSSDDPSTANATEVDKANGLTASSLIATSTDGNGVVNIKKTTALTVKPATPETKNDDSDDTRDDVEAKLGETRCKVYDPMGTLKRRKLSQYEDECYTRDEASLYLITDTQDSIARRCICLSTILRNLTFIPGNEYEFSKNSRYLALMGKLLLIHHEHPLRTQKQQNYDREDDTDFSDCCSSLQGESEWWWDFLHQIRENVLVSIANIAGYVDLSNYLEEVSRPILDGLLHWAVCPAAQGQDPFPTAASLSPQKLALEALCKLCVTDANVDLVIATPPYSRLEKLTSVLTRLLCRSEEQVLREFAINLLHYLAAAESSMARIIALQSPCISLLVAFIEQAEQSALGVANQHGIGALRDNPESMGTSLDMLRRAARTLLHLSRHPDNKPLFLQQEQRLLALVMSQILDQQVAGIISQVLYQCSRTSSSPPTSYSAIAS